MEDPQIHGTIEQLVAEEHALWERESAGNATEEDRQRLQAVKVSLDQCWDLLRQRRALRDAGRDPDAAAVLLAAAVAALIWVNVHASSYDSLWGTRLSIDLGGAGVALDLRHWVNSGLMTFFFFVIGLEARREFDLGELRERRR